MTALVVLMLGFGQLPLRGESLADWINAALDANAELTAARKKWEAAKHKVPQARAFEDPLIGVEVMRDSTRFNSAMATEYMISQKLPWFGKRGAQGSVAQFDAEAVGFEYLELARATEAKVIAAHWNLWLAQRTVALADENRQLLEQFAASARAQYEAGGGRQADLLRAEIELAKLANDVLTLQHELPVAQNAVNRLLNADPNTPRAVAAPAPLEPLTLSLEEMQDLARAYCCIVMANVRRFQARDAGIRAARLEQRPAVEFRVAARQFNGRSGIQEYDTGVAVSFPWLWRGKYKAMVAEATAEKDMAEAELAEEINMTLLEVKELRVEAEAAWRLLTLYADKLLPQARQLVAAARAAYEAGQGTFLELVEAQKAWREAELDHARARAAFGRTSAKLAAIIAPWGEREFATGLATPDMQ